MGNILYNKNIYISHKNLKKELKKYLNINKKKQFSSIKLYEDYDFDIDIDIDSNDCDVINITNENIDLEFIRFYKIEDDYLDYYLKKTITYYKDNEKNENNEEKEIEIEKNNNFEYIDINIFNKNLIISKINNQINKYIKKYEYDNFILIKETYLKDASKFKSIKEDIKINKNKSHKKEIEYYLTILKNNNRINNYMVFYHYLYKYKYIYIIMRKYYEGTNKYGIIDFVNYKLIILF